MKKKLTFGSVVAILLLLAIYFLLPSPEAPEIPVASIEQIPDFSGEPFVVLGDNVPQFTEDDYTTESFEEYAPLDALERCTYTMACIGLDLMPTQERGSISHIKPTGWHSVSYDFVDGKSLYNRCHLIGHQLAGEDANDRNLITGTRYMNVDGMLPFENMVADYVNETGNHVLYRVIPVYEGNNLVADGVTMEAWSVEDNGEGICFYVYVYNVQPGVVIDYATGESRPEEPVVSDGEETVKYVVNVSSGKFHLDDCAQSQNMKESNRQIMEATRSQMIAWNYEPAGCCKP